MLCCRTGPLPLVTATAPPSCPGTATATHPSLKGGVKSSIAKILAP